MGSRKRKPLPGRSAYLAMVSRYGLIVLGILLVSLFMGALGYHTLNGERWVDAVYSASMILTGMGPTGPLRSDGAKLFVTAYALYSAVVFLTSAAILLTPVAHRVLHRFHLEVSGEEDDEEGARGGAGGGGGGRG